MLSLLGINYVDVKAPLILLLVVAIFLGGCTHSPDSKITPQQNDRLYVPDTTNASV